MKTIEQIWKDLDQTPAEKGGFCGKWIGGGRVNRVSSPVDGSVIGNVQCVSESDVDQIIASATEAFRAWRLVPAPQRGLVVRDLGQAIRKHKEALSQLVCYEMGKPLQEARGEVQEMIDIFDYAVGLSRQLYGLTMPSERRQHRLQEQWHPLGTCAVITAFNFPVAVWSWNAALALVCGDTVIWKPSSQTPLCALACTEIAHEVLARHGFSKEICSVMIGEGSVIGDRLIRDARVALVSYTGSVARGRHVGEIVQRRFGRLILELGGNNAVIVSDQADLKMALRAVYFGAIGTAGQRCTSTRRVIIHEAVYADFTDSLKKAFEKTRVGDPREESTLMGPLISAAAVEQMQSAMAEVEPQGGRIVCGGEKLSLPGGCYITPCIAQADNSAPIVKTETFAPLLYLMPYRTIEQALAMHNDVPQGLSSAIMTNDLREAELFLGVAGSDCGIANVNTGTSGAEIGGAFGGEKETGGGRESGSDAWKSYMRRQTNVINFSGGIELAQGLVFDF